MHSLELQIEAVRQLREIDQPGCGHRCLAGCGGTDGDAEVEHHPAGIVEAVLDVAWLPAARPADPGARAPQRPLRALLGGPPARTHPGATPTRPPGSTSGRRNGSPTTRNPLPLRMGGRRRQQGHICNWTQVLAHPVHPALQGRRIPHRRRGRAAAGGNVRMLGNLLGDPRSRPRDRGRGRGRVRASSRRRAGIQPAAMAGGRLTLSAAPKGAPRGNGSSSDSQKLSGTIES